MVVVDNSVTFWSKYSTPSFIHLTSGVGTPQAVQVSVAVSPSFTTTSGIRVIWGGTEMMSIRCFKDLNNIEMQCRGDN